MLEALTQRPVLLLIQLYQVTLSGLVPNSCRFQPTCSQYMYEAVEETGVARGVWMGMRRIARCRPGGGQGYDPVAAAAKEVSGEGEPPG